MNARRRTGGVPAPSYKRRPFRGKKPAVRGKLNPGGRQSLTGGAVKPQYIRPPAAPGGGGGGGGGGKPPLRPLPPAPVGDARMDSQLNALQTRLNSQNLAFNQQEQMTRQEFGFDPQYAKSPYTQASILKRRAQQRFMGTTNSNAAAGQLYSGAVTRDRTADELASGAELDAARKDYAARLANINQGRLDARNAYAEGADFAKLDAVERYTASDPGLLYDDPGEGGGGGGDGGGATPGTKKGAGKTGSAKKGKLGVKGKLTAQKPSSQTTQKARAILANRKNNSPAAVKWAQGILQRTKG
jgi:hypothetical protein